ncbi:MAG: LacI family DNA-binding transcriptional regulator [bacterium]
MSKKVTLQDIADALGISRNTVSKAINNSEGLAEATREKILQKAVEMGYKQFSYMKTLSRLVKVEETAEERQREQKAPAFLGEIAVLSTSYLGLSHHFSSLMLDKLQRELLPLGYAVHFHHISSEDRKARALPFTFVRERVRGILCVELFDYGYGQMLSTLGLPLLFVDGPSRRSGRTLPADQLLMESVSGITRLTNLLLEKGVRRIGFIGDYEHCQSFFERYMAFRGAMLLAEVPVEERYMIKELSVLGIFEALRKLEELPEVFLCANDFVATDALQGLHRLGKRVPEDVMLCGFDDSPESRVFSPPLTTVHIHTQVMAYTAIQLLLSRMEEPNLDYRTVYTETELILRGSTPVLEAEQED